MGCGVQSHRFVWILNYDSFFNNIDRGVDIRMGPGGVGVSLGTTEIIQDVGLLSIYNCPPSGGAWASVKARSRAVP